MLDTMLGSQCTPGEADCSCTGDDIAAMATMDQENPDMSAVSSGCMGCMIGGGEDGMAACMAGGACTPGDADCTCSVADLDYFIATEASDEEPDMSQLSSGCMSCLMAGGEDGTEVCFGMGSDGCSPGTSGCVCDASDYANFELLVVAQMAAEASGQPEPDSSGSVLGGACVLCMSATGALDSEDGQGGEEGPSFDGIDASVAGLTQLCPEEVEACLADNTCSPLLPIVEYQLVDDRMGMIAALCPSEFAECDATCVDELTALASSDEDPDPEAVAAGSAGLQAVFGCVVTSGLVGVWQESFAGCIFGVVLRSLTCRAGGVLQTDDSMPAGLSAVLSCAGVKAYMRSPAMRGCFPPPPAPKVAATVTAVVLTGTDLTAATNTVADALATSRASENNVRAGAPLVRASPKAEIHSAVTFPVDIDTISPGSSERTAFGRRVAFYDLICNSFIWLFVNGWVSVPHAQSL